MMDVTCAIIRNGDEILAVRRSHGMHLAGHWEFPGGKIEPGETAGACITREIMEELNVSIRPLEKLIPVEHHYPGKSIRLIPFICEIAGGEIILAEHAEFRWVIHGDLSSLNWAAADRKLIEVNGLV